MKHITHLYATLFAVFIAHATELSAQTYYGHTGLVQFPDAYLVETDNALAGAFYFGSYTSKGEDKGQAVGAFANVGIHSRINTSIRIIGYPDTNSKDSTSYFSIYFDRMVSTQITVLPEKKHRPQIGAGIQDIIGTQLDSYLYTCATKTVNLFKNVKCIPTIGITYSFRGYKTIWPMDKDFAGFYFGNEFLFFESVSLKTDYNGETVNWGLEAIIKKKLHLSVFQEQKMNTGILLSIKTAI